ncbi:MAG TPA: hypothetical protein VMS17_21960 [Gemmataceae bacterium]|nr:hypothetical protein [Gemmataceae bacterium]
MRSPIRRRLARAAALLLAVAASCRAAAQGLGEPTTAGSGVGYIDPAPPATLFRFRYDASDGDDAPNRAEFFWPRGGPAGPGPRLPERNADYQDLDCYLEAAWAPSFSTFVEVPYRFLHPEVNPDAAGLADMNAGFKYAIVRSDDLVSTFQLRTYIPTGDGARGLGTDHVSLEPAFLVLKRLDDRLTFEGELRDLVPIGGTDFAGDVLRYGVGLDYDLWDLGKVRIAPVVELVGWTVLSGQVSMVEPSGAVVQSGAAGNTIVNAKVGVRFWTCNWGDAYVGYGRALTGDRWYANTFRVEWRLPF